MQVLFKHIENYLLDNSARYGTPLHDQGLPNMRQMERDAWD